MKIIDQVRERIRSYNSEFTKFRICKDTGIRVTSVQSALNKMGSEKEIEIVGYEKRTEANYRPANIYKVVKLNPPPVIKESRRYRKGKEFPWTSVYPDLIVHYVPEKYIYRHLMSREE
jgi:hypothetical protein